MVHTDRDGVATARHEMLRHIILMGCEARSLTTDFLTVDIDGGFGVRAFEEERHALLPPVSGDIDTLSIPSLTHRIAVAFPVGGERAWQHHIIIVMRRVVEGEIPGALQAEDFLSGGGDN